MTFDRKFEICRLLRYIWLVWPNIIFIQYQIYLSFTYWQSSFGPGFHLCEFLECCTTQRIQDKFILSSKSQNLTTNSLWINVFCNKLWTWNCSASSANENRTKIHNFTFLQKRCNSTIIVKYWSN